MGLINNILSIFAKQEKVPEPQIQKSPERLQQENELKELKNFANKISNAGLNSMISNLEYRMETGPYYTFDYEISEIKKYINTSLSDRDKFLLLNKSYKFSKSNPGLSKYFAEGHYFNYDDKQGYAEYPGHRLSVTTNKQGILACAIYGDQLTIFTNNKNSKYYERLKNADIKHIGGKLDEYTSDFLIIEKNLSMSDPYVVKSLLKQSDRITLINFFNNPIFDIEKAYEAIGFSETLDFYRKAKELSKNMITFYDKLDEILPNKDKDKMLDNLIYFKTIDNKKQKVNEISKNINER